MRRTLSTEERNFVELANNIVKQDGCKIFCYDCDTEERDGRAFYSMEEFFGAFPSAEINFAEVVDDEIRVYC